MTARKIATMSRARKIAKPIPYHLPIVESSYAQRARDHGWYPNGKACQRLLHRDESLLLPSKVASETFLNSILSMRASVTSRITSRSPVIYIAVFPLVTASNLPLPALAMNFTGRSVGLKLIADCAFPATLQAFSKKITTRKPYRANLKTTERGVLIVLRPARCPLS